MSRSHTRFVRAGHLAAAACLAIGLAACGGDADADGAFTVAVIEPDVTTVPLLAAIDTLKEDGFDVKTVELAEPELAIEGLAKGEYAISAESSSPALIAAQQGAPVKIIADVVGNQWAFYGNEDIKTCADLGGQPVGIFSEGSVATAMVKDWVANNCNGEEPEYLVIGGSDVRAQALQQGEIVATALEVADVATLAETGQALGEPLADFTAEMPDLHPQTVYANTDFLKDNSEAAQAFIDALAEEHRKINEDPQYLVELMEEYLPDSVSETLPAVAQGYVDAGLFNAVSLDEAGVQTTIDFFVGAGVIEDGLTVEDAADLSFAENARS